MQRQKTKKKIAKYLKKSKSSKSSKSSKRAEYYAYQPDSSLTLHYITTGAILSEKTSKRKNIRGKIQRKVVKKGS